MRWCRSQWKEKGPSKHLHPYAPNFFSPSADPNSSSQSQGWLVFRVTWGSGGCGLALLVEFKEAGFFYHHGDGDGAGAGVAVGIFLCGQSPFLRRFGRVPFPADQKVSLTVHINSEVQLWNAKWVSVKFRSSRPSFGCSPGQRWIKGLTRSAASYFSFVFNLSCTKMIVYLLLSVSLTLYLLYVLTLLLPVHMLLLRKTKGNIV